MVEVFDKLRELQEVLAEKYDLQAQIEEAPKELSSQDELLARLKKEYIEKNAIYEDVRKKVVKLKSDLAEADAAREKSEKGMDSITTHREYEALEKEIRDATEREQTIRKELQKEEKNLAELNDSLKNEESLIQRQEEELNAGKTSLQNKIDEFNQKLDQLKKREEELTPGVDPEIIFKFQRIIKSKHSKGIVAATNLGL
jgi:predicted  nucleic acid-binding Zn-ribbon protein